MAKENDLTITGAPIPRVVGEMRSRAPEGERWRDRASRMMETNERLGVGGVMADAMIQSKDDTDKLVSDVEANIKRLSAENTRTKPPLLDAAIAVSDLRFHHLMAAASAVITGAGDDFKEIEPHKLAIALSMWGLRERTKPTPDAGMPKD